MKIFINRKRKGFTLTEILLVLVIAAAIVISAFIIYPKVQTSQRIDTETRNITTIRSGIQSLYNSSSNYQGLNNDIVLKSNLFPDSMLIGEGDERKAVNIFKGDVEISDTASTPGGVAYSTFSITYTAVPSAECIRLFQALRPYVYIIQINRVAVTDGLSSSPVSAINKCSSTSSNRMTFVFH